LLCQLRPRQLLAPSLLASHEEITSFSLENQYYRSYVFIGKVLLIHAKNSEQHGTHDKIGT